GHCSSQRIHAAEQGRDTNVHRWHWDAGQPCGVMATVRTVRVLISPVSGARVRGAGARIVSPQKVFRKTPRALTPYCIWCSRANLFFGPSGAYRKEVSVMHLRTELRIVFLLICLLIPDSVLGSGFPPLLHKFPVGPTPAGVGVGDFNGDGKLDLVLVNQADRTITVVLGRGNGTFGVPITSTTSVPPAGPGLVFVGDFNGDHKLDIAFDASGISVALGNGDGTFGPTVNSSVPGRGGMVGVADVNGDGKLDLVYSYEVSLTDFTAVFLGNGDGSFQSLRSSTGAFGCTLADLNGDGRSHLVGGFGFPFANSNGTFQT